MKIYQHNTFVGQRIKIDGGTFTNNLFQNCVLVYGGGPLNFSNNQLNNVRWEFIDSAARTMALISSFYQAGGESRQFVELTLSTFAKQVEEPRPTASKGDSNE